MPFSYFGKINFTPYTKVSKFADELQMGRLVGSQCKNCGAKNFPPRADCLDCMSDDFKFIKARNTGTLVTFTTIHSAPIGFEDLAPYTLGLVDVDGGGRVLSWFENTPEKDVKIGMKVKIVPKIFEEIEEIKLYYCLEKAPKKKGGKKKGGKKKGKKK
jgi:uncharacterized OB-fold protein